VWQYNKEKYLGIEYEMKQEMLPCMRRPQGMGSPDQAMQSHWYLMKEVAEGDCKRRLKGKEQNDIS
jgi:hypothetical protein